MLRLAIHNKKKNLIITKIMQKQKNKKKYRKMKENYFHWSDQLTAKALMGG